ncbi:O-methyltransferase [Tumebacillus sp. BK434]|uniref:O-methyltransferase n=1 Tax=Tumebacillus sp. BK434 TaxID=2512169 RepID=UPI001A9F9D23|nr:O-methyltransferase [Tumebacillus sp. BK434]
MIDPTLVAYLRGLVPARSPLLLELEQRAEAGFVPILDLETVSFLQVLLKIAKPRRILEVGTAIGYSALVMAGACEAQITTMERDPERAAEARANFAKAGLQDRIELLEGDALELIGGLGHYDFVFLDAAKGQYPRFLELLDPHLETGGVLLSDNILFQGMVSGQEEVKHKLRTMVNRLREYNELLAHHPGYETTFLPLGDGVSLSVKK